MPGRIVRSAEVECRTLTSEGPLRQGSFKHSKELEAALLAQGLKFVVLSLCAIGLMRGLSAIFILWLLLGLFVEHDSLV